MKINIEKANKGTRLAFANEQEIIDYMNNILYYLQHHNKNLTKEQEYKIDDLAEIIKAVEV